MNKRTLGILVALLAALVAYLNEQGLIPLNRSTHVTSGAPATEIARGNQAISDAYRAQRSDVQVMGQGIVKRMLSDDLDGSRHQRFLLLLDNRQTVLIAHNIDLAPRIDNLQNGDTVGFFGEYEWNNQGGVVHWTHHDPGARHVDGWLKHKGRTYQ